MMENMLAGLPNRKYHGVGAFHKYGPARGLTHISKHPNPKALLSITPFRRISTMRFKLVERLQYSYARNPVDIQKSRHVRCLPTTQTFTQEVVTSSNVVADSTIV